MSKGNGILLSAVTVEGQEKLFSALDCTCAKLLCKIQHILVCPSDYNLTNAIGNNGYTRHNVRNARATHGPIVPGLKINMAKLKRKLPGIYI